MNRHEGTVFLKNLAHTVFVGKFQAVLIQEQSDFGTNSCLAALGHIVLGASVTGPVYRGGSFFIGKRIDVNFICYHESRVETKTEVADHLI